MLLADILELSLEVLEPLAQYERKRQLEEKHPEALSWRFIDLGTVALTDEQIVKLAEMGALEVLEEGLVASESIPARLHPKPVGLRKLMSLLFGERRAA